MGFWSGWEGARKVGALAISGGGQTTQQRLKSLVEYGATVLVCTPTYALHMAAEARRAGMDPARDSAIRVTVHAGEPGASIASTKQRIEEAWGARCFDHTGATEVGAFGFACDALPEGVHVNEDEFIAEVVDAESGGPLPDGCRGELVLTNLGRVGSPVIRYRTGDLVEPRRGPCACGRTSLVLKGGVLGRVDDMVVVRGVNVFPSAVEGIVRQFPEVEEFRVDVVETEGLAELKVTVEPSTAENVPGAQGRCHRVHPGQPAHPPGGGGGCAGDSAAFRAQGQEVLSELSSVKSNSETITGKRLLRLRVNGELLRGGGPRHPQPAGGAPGRAGPHRHQARL